ncbi:MAG: SIS domain-containing protein [Lachnospiraceae bacterium]|nr:SIS domain-containing protein [Lachnospiraceae bacterium]
MEAKKLIIQRFQDSIALKEQNIKDDALVSTIVKIAEEIIEVIKNGNKLILCGNGGSASDALHFAGEIVGRFQKERSAWAAVVLNADVTTMTAIANDYGYDEVFARQAEGLTKSGDLFIGISTSGNSENVLRAVKVAKGKGAKTAALLGKDGGKISNEVDYPVIVRCNITARVQESHINIIHSICEIVEDALSQ